MYQARKYDMERWQVFLITLKIKLIDLRRTVSSTADTTFLHFLRVLRNLPIKEITVRSYSDLGEEVWEQLRQMTGLRKVAIWSMEGPPRVLQGWSDKLGDTLTHLELGVRFSFSAVASQNLTGHQAVCWSTSHHINVCSIKSTTTSRIATPRSSRCLDS